MLDENYVVYPPPHAGLPFLAVIIAADGSVIATPYETAEEAAEHIKEALVVSRKGAENDKKSGLLDSLLP